jgi:hypothetical protein
LFIDRDIAHGNSREENGPGKDAATIGPVWWSYRGVGADGLSAASRNAGDQRADERQERR